MRPLQRVDLKRCPARAGAREESEPGDENATEHVDERDSEHEGGDREPGEDEQGRAPRADARGAPSRAAPDQQGPQDEARHRLTAGVRVPEVAVEDPTEVVEVLLPQREVEAEAPADFLEYPHRASRSAVLRRRVARCHEVRDEDEGPDHPEGDDALEGATDQIRGHGLTKPW